MTRLKLPLTFAALVLSVGLSATPAHAQMTNGSPAPDNTAVNARDRDACQPTADQASNKLTDRQLMQGIRKAVVHDKGLSTYAHNVKIVALNGKVTLKGPVKSQDEVDNIEAKAEQVAGNGNVTNELSVKTP